MKEGSSTTVRVCVFCSAGRPSVKGLDEEVDRFVTELEVRKGRLIYGGGAMGLMGQFADRAIEKGLSVWGGITERLNQDIEVGHKGIEKLVVLADLFERKRWFFANSDVFFVYPGGFGTLDEAFEVLTWVGLGEFQTPLIFVDLDGFWTSLKALFFDLKSRGVLRIGWPESIVFAESSADAWRIFDELKARERVGSSYEGQVTLKKSGEPQWSI